MHFVQFESILKHVTRGDYCIVKFRVHEIITQFPSVCFLIDINLINTKYDTY